MDSLVKGVLGPAVVGAVDDAVLEYIVEICTEATDGVTAASAAAVAGELVDSLAPMLVSCDGVSGENHAEELCRGMVKAVLSSRQGTATANTTGSGAEITKPYPLNVAAGPVMCDEKLSAAAVPFQPASVSSSKTALPQTGATAAAPTMDSDGSAMAGESGRVLAALKVGSSVDADVAGYMVEVARTTVLEDFATDATEVVAGELEATLGPLLESAGVEMGDDDLRGACMGVVEILRGSSAGDGAAPSSTAESNGAQRLAAPVSLGDLTEANTKQAEAAMSDLVVGVNATWRRAQDAGQRERVAAEEEKNKAKIQKREAKKEQQAQRAAEDADANGGELKSFLTYGEQAQAPPGCVKITNISMEYNRLPLLVDTDLLFNQGRRYGLVGRNGLGKSTLMRHIARPGELPLPDGYRIMFVEQEAVGDDTPAIQVVLNADKDRVRLMEMERDLLKAQEEGGDVTDLTSDIRSVYEKLAATNADAAHSNAARILSGLQFSKAMQEAPTRSLSGGWRMRLALACALFMEPDLLLLDEPTNHLDMHACIWLESYLQKWTKTLIVVSHDQEFLNNVCSDIIHLHLKKLHYYRGNFDSFLKTKEERDLEHRRAYEAQQNEIQHMQAFVDKWLHNKFGNNRGMVQDRIKKIEKLKTTDRIDKPPDKSQVHFNFPTAERIADPMVHFKEVAFGYRDTQPFKAKTLQCVDGGDLLFDDVHLKINTGSKMAVVGPNGVGKSTLLKLVTEEYRPTYGAVVKKGKLRIGYFTQHFVDSLDMSTTPLGMMRTLLGPQATEGDLRRAVGAFGLSGDLGTRQISLLSGGQKSRVVLATMCVKEPHLLVLDEPTNHLDIESINSLAEALKRFSGAVLLVSHDERLISQVCNELWHVDGNGNVTCLECSFKEYKAKLQVDLG